MKAIAAFMRRARARPSTGPEKAAKTPHQRTSPDPFKTLSIAKHTTMKTFARSPLATSAALTAAEVDALDRVFTHPEVQRAAGRLHLKRQSLLEAAGFRSAIAEGIAASGEPAGDSPEQVVAVLEHMAREVDDEIDAVSHDHAQHDARHKARLVRQAPLRNAVSARATVLTNERDTCLTRIDAVRRASTMTGSGVMRHANLVAAGLTAEQINALGPAAQPTETQEATLKDRVAEIDIELLLLKTFQADERDVTPLAGLGYDALIQARNVAEKVPA